MKKQTDIKKKAALISERLFKLYPEVRCELNYKKPIELLIATRLSAQCTDKRVNMITPVLFGKYGSVDDFAVADVSDVEKIIMPCGLYHTKAADIVAMCGIIKERFSGEVPENLEDLLILPGVGRKTANLIVGELYGKPAIVTDTHVIRLSGRLGLSRSKEPNKVEDDLRMILPSDQSLGFCHRLVHYGREVCSARRPKCEGCTLHEFCVNPPAVAKKP